VQAAAADTLIWSSIHTTDNTAQALIDGAQVYTRIAAALASARHSVCIAAWDLDLDASLIQQHGSSVTFEDALLARAMAGVRIRLLIWRPAPYLPTMLCPIAARVAAMERRCRRLQIDVRVQVASVMLPADKATAPLSDTSVVNVVFVSGPSGILSAHHEKLVLMDADCPEFTVAFAGVCDMFAVPCDCIVVDMTIGV